jgi:hypothetical protein
VEWVLVDRLEDRPVVSGLVAFLAEVGMLER